MTSNPTSEAPQEDIVRPRSAGQGSSSEPLRVSELPTVKVAVNKCFGGFSLSEAATELLAHRGNEEAVEHLRMIASGELSGWYDFHPYEPSKEQARQDSNIIAVIEELGQAANGTFAEIRIVEVPADVSWDIEEYDGREWVSERHRTW